MQKHFSFTRALALDAQVATVRSVKSWYELSLMERAGAIHRHVLEDCVPDLLQEGIDEVTLATDLYSVMVKEGHQGIIRFGMFNEMLLGQIGFGTSSIAPICVDTPGGVSGLHPSAPMMGSRERKLKKGDLVVIDIGCGVEGYQTDKTMTYMFGRPLPDAAIRVHEQCVAVQDQVAALLKSLGEWGDTASTGCTAPPMRRRRAHVCATRVQHTRRIAATQYFNNQKKQIKIMRSIVGTCSTETSYDRVGYDPLF